MSYLAPIIAALLGAIVGASLTSALAHLASSRREARQNKLKVLMVLMSGRGGIFAADVAENINIIPVLFHDDEKVRRAYQHLCAIPNSSAIDLYNRYNDLVLAVAASLNFRDLTAADMDLGYYPTPNPGLQAVPPLANTQSSKTAVPKSPLF